MMSISDFKSVEKKHRCEKIIVQLINSGTISIVHLMWYFTSSVSGFELNLNLCKFGKKNVQLGKALFMYEIVVLSNVLQCDLGRKLFKNIQF